MDEIWTKKALIVSIDLIMSTAYYLERYRVVYQVVFPFSRGSCAGFPFNCHVAFFEPQDNRYITATFCAKSAILADLNMQVLQNSITV